MTSLALTGSADVEAIYTVLETVMDIMRGTLRTFDVRFSQKQVAKAYDSTIAERFEEAVVLMYKCQIESFGDILKHHAEQVEAFDLNDALARREEEFKELLHVYRGRV